jgi:choline dehydrogenase-like flavoprotein
LLLASTDDAPDGVGNSSGTVGRFFADHPSLPPIEVVPGPAGSRLGLRTQPNERTGMGVTIVEALSPTQDAQRRLGLAGFHAFLLPSPAEVHDELLAQGVEQVVALHQGPVSEVRSVLLGFEQIPNPDSRVVLDDARDELGERRAALRWRLTDDDEDHMRRGIELLARGLARAGLGRLRLTPGEGEWRDRVIGQHHHMGTLRMSASPRDGVVDGDLRFHDVPNLFAAGSAVFPVQGHVNPTLNLVALALRLGEHLAREVG